MQDLLLRPCSTPDELHAWVRLFTGLNVPRRALCPEHDAPFDYLCRSYFEPATDLVVWAPRGGGKTRLAALATLLDLLHKPPASVRILGGSLEQSMKMWDYLLPDLSRLARRQLARRPSDSARRVRLGSGSSAAVLTQSQRAVRGLRIQKLRCDEVELFDPEIWEAAQLTTRSIRGEAVPRIAGAVEALSTLHITGGLMSRIVDQAGTRGTRRLKWCLLDVLKRCEPERNCDGCPLWAECRGRAKRDCDGFVSIDDAIRMKQRVSVETWQSEMLCQRPSTRGRVFPHFDENVHVAAWEPSTKTSSSRATQGQCVGGPDGPHPAAALQPDRHLNIALAIDFGYANPFVCLWIALRPDGAIHVIDEHIAREMTLAQHLDIIARRPWPRARRIYCDPAGAGRSGQTATSDIGVLRGAGYAVRFRASRIHEGIEAIRCALAPASGPPRLFIDPRCTGLIAALAGYRYAPGGGEKPIKDGEHDHPIDALRYYFVNTMTSQAVRVSRY